MTALQIFDLRKSGMTEEAYEAARRLYSTDKGQLASSAMFWTAVDMLKSRVLQGQLDESRKILAAMQRLLQNIPCKEEGTEQAFLKCQSLLEDAVRKADGKGLLPDHIQTGRWGEELAAAYLRGKGYIILETDWRSGHRDIDIIARDHEYTVFVEVKTRSTDDYGSPLMAIDYKKRHNLRQAINHYVKYRSIVSPIRFDIVSIVGSPKSLHPVIEHLEDVNII